MATPDKPDEKTGASPAIAGAPSAGAPSDAPVDEYDFDKVYTGLDERFRTDYESRAYNAAYNQFNQALEKEYGDILPLVVAAKEDPELRKTLSRLTEKELREFLFGQALPIYERNHAAAPTPATPGAEAADPKIQELEKRLDASEKRWTDAEHTAQMQSYQSTRVREMEALQNEIGEPLRWESDKDAAYKLAAHVVDIAESRFERAARARGVNTNSAGWIAQAEAAGIRPPSYREVYDELAEISGRTAPPAAPATSSSSPPRRPQAPRDATEGREAGLKLLKQTGGLRGLAATAASKRGR